jgi:acyl transferase domain-containing protein
VTSVYLLPSIMAKNHDQEVITNGHQVLMTNGHSTPATQTQSPIAVIGVGCRLPGRCNSPHALWDFISQGSIASIETPKSRFRLAGHYDGSRKPGTMPTPGGMFLEDVDPAAFDSSFFNTSKADAITMDPQQRLMLEVTYECLENCGLTLEHVRGANIGCLVGVNACGMLWMQSCSQE